jgi:hypothetical protein
MRFIHKIGSYIKINIIHKIGSYIKINIIHKIGSYIKINIKKMRFIHKIGSYIKINIIHKIGSYIKINIKKMRFIHKMGPLKVLNNHLINYPTPMNLSYAYNFGSLAGILLASQIITGILLAMHYVGHVDLAFNSVVHLMNDVPSGMILRYAHANGASLFFTVVYIHILRGVYYSSGNQPREAVWITGVVILLVMVLTAFIG